MFNDVNPYGGSFLKVTSPLNTDRLNKFLFDHNIWVKTKGKKGKRANFSGYVIENVDLSGKNLEFASFYGSDITNVNLSNANLFSVDFIAVKFTNVNLNGAILQYANISHSNIFDSELINADLSNLNFYGHNFSNKDLRNAMFHYSNLSYCDFSGADITGAKFFETQISHWKINNIVCEYAYWDEQSKEIIHYKPGEFERFHKDYPAIRLQYNSNEYSLVQHNFLPIIVNYLNKENPDFDIVLRKIEEAPNGCEAVIELRAYQVTESNLKEIEKKIIYYINLLKEKEKQLEFLDDSNKFLRKQIQVLQNNPQQNIFNNCNITLNSSYKEIDKSVSINNQGTININKILQPIQDALDENDPKVPSEAKVF